MGGEATVILPGGGGGEGRVTVACVCMGGKEGGSQWHVCA